MILPMKTGQIGISGKLKREAIAWQQDGSLERTRLDFSKESTLIRRESRVKPFTTRNLSTGLHEKDAVIQAQKPNQ